MLKFFRRSTKENKAKTEQAVRRSRQTFFGQMTGLFRRQQIDDALWDELEELLISADVGVATTFKLIERLRDQIRDPPASQTRRTPSPCSKKRCSTSLTSRTPTMRSKSMRSLSWILMVGINGRRQDHQHRQADQALSGRRQERAHWRSRHIPRRRHRTDSGLGRALRC